MKVMVDRDWRTAVVYFDEKTFNEKERMIELIDYLERGKDEKRELK